MDTIKRSNISMMGVPGGKEEKGTENIFEEIITEK